MDSALLIVIILVGLAVIGSIIWMAGRLQQMQTGKGEGEALALIQNQMNQLQRELGDRMGETRVAVQTQATASVDIVRKVTEELKSLQETNKQVLNVTESLKHLEDILKNPKQRGILGEYYLENVLKNVLGPDGYQMQYKFKDGEIVDAAVFVKDKIVPIDSKFSLENYNRMVEEKNTAEKERLEKLFVNDLKLRIKETAKYIRPQEGTMEFAFMFIPHEAIYYDLLIGKIGSASEDNESILQRAAGQYHVLVVSPTSFLAYLQTVLQGLRALKIEEQAKEIQARVGDLGRHLAKYEENFTSVGKNLGTAVNQYNLASKEFAKIDKDILRIDGSNGGYEAAQIDKPSGNE